MTKKQYYIRDRHLGILVDTIKLVNGLVWFEDNGHVVSYISNNYHKLKYHFTNPDGTIHFKIVEK